MEKTSGSDVMPLSASLRTILSLINHKGSTTRLTWAVEFLLMHVIIIENS